MHVVYKRVCCVSNAVPLSRVNYWYWVSCVSFQIFLCTYILYIMPYLFLPLHPLHQLTIFTVLYLPHPPGQF